jgi:hypothetical protein
MNPRDTRRLAFSAAMTTRGKPGLHTPEAAELRPAQAPGQVLRPVAAERRPRWDRHIRYLKRPPAARPSDDRRSTSIRRQTTNNRTVRSDIRRDANARLPRTGVRVRPSGCGRGRSAVLRRQSSRLVGLRRVLAQLYHAVQVRPVDGRRQPQDAQPLLAPWVARPAPLAPVFCLLVRPLPTMALLQKSTPKKWISSAV